MSKTIENTLENKAKFFAMYLDQEVYCIEGWNRGVMICDAHKLVKEEFNYLKKSFLILKPLSSISDEDAEYCIGKTECSMRKNDPNSGDYGMSPSLIFVNSMMGDSSYHIGRREADYLRSKGYALKWMNKTVKEQILDGWVKLKGETK